MSASDAWHAFVHAAWAEQLSAIAIAMGTQVPDATERLIRDVGSAETWAAVAVRATLAETER